jgi:hypothetical protein
MTERWDPAVHELVYRVDVSPEDHIVHVNAVPYFVVMVTMRYRRVADEVNEWQGPRTSVACRTRRIGRAGEIWQRHQLDRVPDWLLDIETRAQPTDP